MEKRTKTLLLSMLTLCICTLLVVGGTFALFTDKVTVNNHLSAGNLDVGLYRTSYKECVLDADGLMAESAENTKKINLVENPNELFTVSKAVPTSWYQATMEVSNKGTTAFDYGVCILWTDTKVGDKDYCENDEIIASQIRITITSENISDEVADGTVIVTDESGNPVEVNYVTFMLDKCNLEENKISLGYLCVGDPVETFTVKAEFVDDEVVSGIVNDDAMNSELKFDVQVYATQKTSLN